MKDINNVRPPQPPRPPQSPFMRVDWIPFGSILFGATLMSRGVSFPAACVGFLVGMSLGAFVGLLFNQMCYPIDISKETPQ